MIALGMCKLRRSNEGIKNLIELEIENIGRELEGGKESYMIESLW